MNSTGKGSRKVPVSRLPAFILTFFFFCYLSLLLIKPGSFAFDSIVAVI